MLQTFAYLGIAYFVVIDGGGSVHAKSACGIRSRRDGRRARRRRHSGRKMDYTLGRAWATWQWWALWLMLFLNTTAGISLISQESPMFQEIAR